MNLAIFCPGWVGDAVMATPALRALRTHFPRARLSYVVKAYVADVLKGTPYADDWLIDGPPVGRTGSGLAALVSGLRRRRIGLAVLLTNSFRSAMACRLAGIRRIVGYARDGRGWLLTDRLQPRREGRRFVPSPVIDYYLALAYYLGCAPESYRLELWTDATDERQAEAVWERLGLVGRRPLVLLNPGAAFGTAKCWPPEYFAALADLLVRRRGAQVLVLCGPKERPIARQIAQACASPRVVSLADEPVSIGLSKACVRRADLLVTTDSGPRHFAAAFDVPVVTIFGPTHIAWTETYYAKAVHVQERVECGPCQQRVCDRDHRCMRELRPERVFAAAVDLLDRYAPAGGGDAAPGLIRAGQAGGPIRQGPERRR